MAGDATFASRIAGMPLPALVKAYSATALLVAYCCTELLGDDDGSGRNNSPELRLKLEQTIYRPAGAS